MAIMYPHQPLKSIQRRSFHIDYIDPLGGPGTLLMEGLSVGGTLKDAERRFPELTITRVYLQAGNLERVGSRGSLGQARK
ncbi:hypothetical protein BO91_00355 [Candidatus Synechococcus spongiarum LMB bulk10E]|uniref:Uncharacterized protein n=2 Tax=Candidatus Synechococcus spongiarum TaxID=431041 RepID=A0A1T1D3R0_9SYNE|nr:hypothetical protein [Candidatus Synechococcus spongiarum]OOV34177.1 hypothetical protein BV53_06295 [Candidatus Synechococcus spongiarum LMB bulk15N]OOV35335.1 hypothetical protein BO91_00355 [Candidatus Synechococcus spongiarum LMB bulk10E]OOV35388.1 hypothetical protein BV61_00910 [Candidatus Synechococcus spongiarum LMB bulk15M]